MIITEAEYNTVVNGLRQQLMLHAAKQVELSSVIKQKDETNDRAAKYIDGLLADNKALNHKVSDALAENLSLAAKNLELFNDLQKAKDVLSDTQIEVMQLRASVQRLNKKLNKRK